MGKFDLVQGDHHKGGLGQLDQSVCGRLNEDIGAVGNTGEPNFSEGDVDIHTLVLSSISNFLCERLKLAVKSGSPASLLLLGLELFLVSIAMLAPTVASLVKLHLGSLAIELDVPCLSLSNHDRSLQMHVDEDNHFVSTGLEEEMFDVAEEYINMLIAER